MEQSVDCREQSFNNLAILVGVVYYQVARLFE